MAPPRWIPARPVGGEGAGPVGCGPGPVGSVKGTYASRAAWFARSSASGGSDTGVVATGTPAPAAPIPPPLKIRPGQSTWPLKVLRASSSFVSAETKSAASPSQSKSTGWASSGHATCAPLGHRPSVRNAAAGAPAGTPKPVVSFSATSFIEMAKRE